METQGSFDERRHAEWLAHRYPEFWQRFGGVPDFTGKRVIDFGCGRGGMVQRVMEAGASSALGIELDADYLAFANRKVASQWDGPPNSCSAISAKWRSNRRISSSLPTRSSM